MFAQVLAQLTFSGIALGHFFHNNLPLGSSFGLTGQNATYDYVIVGGGTAGNALAYRLAADGRYSVAVIEAGSFYELDSGNRSVIPGYAPYNNSLIDWGFQTTPQETLTTKIQPYARGKCLGGSSARNYMVYQRPSVGSMQKWADEVGDQSYTFENTLKYYKRSTTFTPPTNGIRRANSTPSYDASVFGNGPVQVSYSNYVPPVASWQVLGHSQVGNPLARGGFVNGSLIGHDYIMSSMEPRLQERSSSQSSYLDLALRTTQLTVYTRTLAKRLLFSANRTATGIQVESNGVTFNISAAKEVIVSAGAFQSPQFLMVSGIGPKKTLQKLSIPVIHNLPGVGQNLQDNPLFGISYAVNTESGSTYINNPNRMAQAVEEYNHNRTGFLASSGADLISFVKLVNQASLNISTQAQRALSWVPEDWPDAQIWGFAAYFGAALTAPPPDTKNYAGFVGSLTAPLSRGSVSIASADMADPPLIDPQWMTDPTDQEMAVAALRRMRQILDTDAMRQVAPHGEVFPGANVTSFEGLLDVARGQSGSFYHASATNKMGRANDSMAVVDSKARVYGVHRLRVVDVSAFPFLPPGQPLSTVYMLAEKIADDILGGEDDSGHSEL